MQALSTNEVIESLKLQILQTRLNKAKQEALDGNSIDGKIFFEELNSDQYD